MPSRSKVRYTAPQSRWEHRCRIHQGHKPKVTVCRLRRPRLRATVSGRRRGASGFLPGPVGPSSPPHPDPCRRPAGTAVRAVLFRLLGPDVRLGPLTCVGGPAMTRRQRWDAGVQGPQIRVGHAQSRPCTVDIAEPLSHESALSGPHRGGASGCRGSLGSSGPPRPGYSEGRLRRAKSPPLPGRRERLPLASASNRPIPRQLRRRAITASLTRSRQAEAVTIS